MKLDWKREIENEKRYNWRLRLCSLNGKEYWSVSIRWKWVDNNDLMGNLQNENEFYRRNSKRTHLSIAPQTSHHEKFV